MGDADAPEFDKLDPALLPAPHHHLKWPREGRLVFPHTVVDGGLAAVPRALVARTRGAHRGTTLVRLSQE